VRLLGFLVFLLLVVGVVGYFRGWISFTSETQAGDRSFSIQVNEEGMKDDLSKAKSKVSDLLEDIGSGEVSGTVESVNVRKRTMVVRTDDGETVTLDLPEALSSQLSGFRAGDAINVEVDDAQVKSLRPGK
jgi:hypothetical protein